MSPPTGKPASVPDLPHILTAALLSLQDPADWDPTVLHASDLGYSTEIEDASDRGCRRQLYLRTNEVKSKAPTPGVMLMWDQGHRIHERMSELLELGFDILGEPWKITDIERRVDEDLDGGLIGTLDVLMEGPDGVRVVMDYKTKRGRAFRFLETVKPGNKLQLQSYMKAKDARYGIILYVDREGSNFVKQFLVERDDERVRRAYEDVRGVVEGKEKPPVHAPKIEIRENQGPDSVKLSLPWQCEWCDFYQHGCDGALPPITNEDGETVEVANRVVGHLVETEDGETFDYRPREGYESIGDMVEAELRSQGLLDVPVEKEDAPSTFGRVAA